MVWKVIDNATQCGRQCMTGTVASNNFLIYRSGTVNTKVSQELCLMISAENLFVLIVYSGLLLVVRLHFIIIFMHFMSVY